MNYNLIDSIFAIKLELDNNINDNVQILIAIKNILNQIDNYSLNDINKILKSFYSLYPSNNINNNIIDFYTNEFRLNRYVISLNIPNNINEDIPLVLKEEDFNNLKKCFYKDLENNLKDNNKICTISYEEFNEDTEIICLPCNHILTFKYGKEWLNNVSYKCPCCRQPCGNYYAKI